MLAVCFPTQLESPSVLCVFPHPDLQPTSDASWRSWTVQSNPTADGHSERPGTGFPVPVERTHLSFSLAKGLVRHNELSVTLETGSLS